MTTTQKQAFPPTDPPIAETPLPSLDHWAKALGQAGQIADRIAAVYQLLGVQWPGTSPDISPYTPKAGEIAGKLAEAILRVRDRLESGDGHAHAQSFHSLSVELYCVNGGFEVVIRDDTLASQIKV